MHADRRWLFSSVLAVLFFMTTGSAPMRARQAAQSAPPAVGMDEASALTQGWALLAQGLLDAAVAHAEDTLRRYPRNPSALTLTLEAHVARYGATAALDRYEQWLGARPVEDAYALRRVARAVLWETARQPSSGGRFDALKALLADGDGTAAEELSRGLDQGNLADTQIMAALGSEEAVRRLIDRMNGDQPLLMGQIRAMGDSRSPLAVQPLLALLADARPEFRAAAAEGLGRMQAREAITPLRGLLEDRHPSVRLHAAAALWLMDDGTGLPVLRQFEESEHPAIRLGAAQATATRPDAGWESRVRGALQADDPLVRIQAATLLAPHDREAARQALNGLANHDNIAIREAVERAMAGTVADDLRSLRGLLRSSHGAVRAFAATRVLEQTR